MYFSRNIGKTEVSRRMYSRIFNVLLCVKDGKCLLTSAVSITYANLILGYPSSDEMVVPFMAQYAFPSQA